MEKLKKLLNRETILYLVFGVATTLVNYIVFYLIYDLTFGRDNSLVANGAAFVAAVVFAFVVNKLFVFESKSWGIDVLRREIPAFLTGRVASFLIEEAGLFLCEKVWRLNGVVVLQIGGTAVDGVTAAKLALSVIVVILNYIFCKLIVFKK